jgi:hypothetical protein
VEFGSVWGIFDKFTFELGFEEVLLGSYSDTKGVTLSKKIVLTPY